ncbi:hypothetical protein TNCV_2204041 [Trichonephila clavipes]|nr:hypothetical protein TNCV_2204041 [Trichonephila clavipes]
MMEITLYPLQNSVPKSSGDFDGHYITSLRPFKTGTSALRYRFVALSPSRVSSISLGTPLPPFGVVLWRGVPAEGTRVALKHLIRNQKPVTRIPEILERKAMKGIPCHYSSETVYPSPPQTFTFSRTQIVEIHDSQFHLLESTVWGRNQNLNARYSL